MTFFKGTLLTKIPKKTLFFGAHGTIKRIFSVKTWKWEQHSLLPGEKKGKDLLLHTEDFANLN